MKPIILACLLFFLSFTQLMAQIPPGMDAITDLTVDEDALPITILLQGITDNDILQDQTLTINASSDNPTLITDITVNYISPNPTGELILSLGANANGTARVTVTVEDPDGTFQSGFFLTVNPINDTPIFTSLPVTGATQDLLYSYTITASDPDGDALNFPPVVLPVWLTLTDNGNNTATLEGTPANGDVGDHSITLQVSDTELSAEQSFTLTVENVNDAPVFSSLPVNTATQDILYIYTVTASDPDGDALSFPPVVLPAWLTLTDNGDNTATLEGTPANGDVGDHSITLQVSDTELSAEQSFTLTVENVNDAPVFSSLPVITATQDVPYSYTVTASDPDGDALSFPPVVLPAWLTLTDNGNNTATLEGTPANGDVGDHSITLQVSDTEFTATQVFTLVVENVNDAPVFSSLPVITATQDVPYSYTVTASDPDGDALSFPPVVLPAWLTLTDNGNNTATLEGTPANGDVGDHSITLQVSDTELSAEQSFTLTVENANDGPVFTSLPITTATQDVPYSYTVTASDPDDENLTFPPVTLPAWLTLTDNGDNTATLQGTPANGDVGNHPISLQVSDAEFTATQVFTLVVENVNDAPVFSSLPVITATQDVPYSYTVTASDPDGDALNFPPVVLPVWLTLTDNGNNTATLEGTPANGDVGDHSITLQVSDTELSAEQSFTLTVENANDGPVFTSLPITTATQGVLYSYTVTASDPDGENLTFPPVTLPAWLTLTDNGDNTATLQGTPANGDVGNHAISLQVSDAEFTATQVFTLVVENVNDAPVFSSLPVITATQDVPYSYTVTASDPDGDALSFPPVVLPGWLTLTDNGNNTATLEGTPANGDVGDHSITLQVSDTEFSAEQSFTLTVENANDGPVFTSLPITTATQGVLYSYTVTASDPDGENLTFPPVTLPAWLTLTDNGDNTATLQGTPANGDVGNHAISLQVSDAEFTATQAFTLVVGNVNDAPVFSSLPVTTATQDLLYSYTVTASDPDGDALSFPPVVLPAWLNLTDNGNNTATLQGTPANGDVGNHAISLQVSDGETSATQAFTLVVGNVNDAPAFTSLPITTATQGVLYSYTVTANDPDGESLTFPSVTLPGWLTLTDNGNNTATLQGTPANGDVGNHALSLQVSDGEASATQAFTLVVGNVNDAPVFSSLPVITATQDVPYSYTVTASDPDGDALSFPPVVLPGWLNLTDNGNNTATLQGTPANADVGDHTITLQVSDAELTATQPFTITVIDVNDDPVAQNGSYTTAENLPIVIPIYNLVSDADNNLDFNTLLVTSAPTTGTTTVNPTAQTITYIPFSGTTGTDQFTYSISDEEGSSDAGIITIQVIGQRPNAVDDNFSLNEDAVTTLSPLLNDTDPQNNIAPGTLQLLTNPSHGRINTDEFGVFSYTPDLNYFGNDQMSYRICDEEGYCDEAFIYLTILPVNDAPVVMADVANTTEEIPVDIAVLTNDNDPNDPNGGINATSVLIVQNPSNGSVTVNASGILTYTPILDFNGQDSFIYSVADNGVPSPALRAQTTVTINVAAVNDAPVALDDRIFTGQGTATNYNLLSNDNDSKDPLGGIDASSLQIIQQPKNGSIIILPNFQINYSPFNNFFGRDTARYVIADRGNPLPALTDTAWIYLEVTQRSPTAVDDEGRTNEDTPVAINVLGNDIDTDINPETITIQSFPENGAVSVGASGVVTYTPALNFFGNDQFTYTVRDRTNLISNTATVNIEVIPVPDAPVTIDAGYTTRENTPLTISLTGLVSDAENNQDYATLQIIQLSHVGTVEQTTALTQIIFTPLTGFTGTATFQYRISDEDGLRSNLSTITVIVSNEAPTAMDDLAETTEDRAVTINILDNDTDPQNNLNPGSVRIITPPVNGTVSVSAVSGSLIYTPAANFYGTDHLVYRVCDEDGYCDEARVDLTVLPENDAPSAVNDAFQTDEDTQLFMDILNNDVDVDNVLSSLTISLVSGPEHGTLFEELNPRGFNYRPAANYFGNDSFVYRLTDPDGASGEATVSIEVRPVNDPPIAVDDRYETNEDTPLFLDVLTNDSDADHDIETMTLTVVSGPLHGSLTDEFSPGGFTYQPDPDYFGSDTFVYQITSPVDSVDQATVTIVVLGVNDAPVATDDFFQTNEDTQVVLDVLANDTDVDHDRSTWILTLVSEPGHGTITEIPESQTFNYQPDVNYHGNDQFVYRVSDPTGAFMEATVTIEVVAQNDPPNAFPDAYAQLGATGAWLAVLANDTDPEDNIDPSTLTVTVNPVHGSTNVDPQTGEIFYQPVADFFGVDEFTYRICDTEGACATALVTLQVTAGNTAPLAVNDTLRVMDGTLGSIWVAENDADAEGQALTYTLISETETLYGTIQLDPNGSLTYQAQTDVYCNTDLLEYRVCDPLGACDTALVVVFIIPADLNGNHIPDILEGDSDGDNIPDSIEAGTLDICNEPYRDTDGDGTPDYLDSDSDNDGINDSVEGFEDCDNDGLPNYRDAFDDCGDRLKVPSTFSPNGDLINDTWVIPGISDFPTNELFIYNRWGGLVYHKKGYDNTWDGRGSSGMLGSDQLAEGTYFYILKLGERVEKGTVYIKR